MGNPVTSSPSIQADRAHRTDEIVANPRTQQRREFEGVGGGTGRRGARHQMFLEIRESADAANQACLLA